MVKSQLALTGMHYMNVRQFRACDRMEKEKVSQHTAKISVPAQAIVNATKNTRCRYVSL